MSSFGIMFWRHNLVQRNIFTALCSSVVYCMQLHWSALSYSSWHYNTEAPSVWLPLISLNSTEISSSFLLPWNLPLNQLTSFHPLLSLPSLPHSILYFLSLPFLIPLLSLPSLPHSILYFLSLPFLIPSLTFSPFSSSSFLIQSHPISSYLIIGPSEELWLWSRTYGTYVQFNPI